MPIGHLQKNQFIGGVSDGRAQPIPSRSFAKAEDKAARLGIGIVRSMPICTSEQAVINNGRGKP